MTVKTNAADLVSVSVTGQVAHPSFRASRQSPTG